MKNVDLNLLAKSNPEQTIRQHTDNLLKNLETLKYLGYLSDENLYNLCSIACEYHDYGKVNAEFQDRIKKHYKFDSEKEIGHNILSIYFVDKDKHNIDEIEHAIILNAILNHHNHVNNIAYLENNKALIKDKIKDYDVSIKARTIKKVKDNRNTNLAIFIQGILYRCDYSASGGIEIEYPNDFLEKYLDKLFESFEINPLQKFCQQHKDDNLIITAPTGMGKTEASLLWLGNNKGFYILPLKTAINSMYFRLCNLFEKQKLDERLALIHSDNLSVLSNIEDVETELDVFDYANLSKNFSLPITVCTPDQIFNFVFKYPSYELKLATLSYSKIIIDEIQAYNAELLAYIIYGIHRIMEMGGKVGIFTATLAPYILDLLNEPYVEKHDKSPFLMQDFSSEYGKTRHNVKVIDEEINTDDIIDTFNQKAESNKILVVCNTVKKAQAVYRSLCAELGDKSVKLLHAKFTKVDRAKKEEEVLSDGNTDVHKWIIWVSTQIVEASLDIDFDFLFTELSELSGLFQRMGRCNRKGVKSVDEYNCFVYTKIDTSLLTSDYSENRGFIDKSLYELSREALKNVNGILTEEQKNQLLQEHFTSSKLEGSKFIDTYKRFYKRVEILTVGDKDVSEVEKRFRNIISENIIPKSVYDEHSEEIEKYVKVLSNSDISDYKTKIMEKQKAKQKIEQYCISVNPWDKGSVETSIKINKFNKIPVICCGYDENVGFTKATENERENNATGMFL